MRLIAGFLLSSLLATGLLFAEDKKDIEYGQAGGESLKLDAHVPDGKGPFPVLVVVHGGGWGTGDKAKGMEPILDPLTRSDEFTWFSINYRLAPTNHWPACFEDVQTAIRWAKAHAAEYKGDPKRIALIGYSAGGELITLAATLAKEDTQVQAVVGFSPPTDMVADTAHRGGLSKSLQALFGKETVDDGVKKRLLEMSAIDYVKPGLPPFLLIQGDADKTVPIEQTRAFEAVLKTNNVPVDFVVLKGAQHRIADWVKYDRSYGDRVVLWLEQVLRVAHSAPSTPTKPDITVASDGSGDFKTVQDAVNSIPHDNKERRIISIRDGVYHEKVKIDPSFVSLCGESRQGTRIEFPQGADDFTNHPDNIGRAVININGSDCVLQNLTIKNTHGVIGPHAFAIYGRGDRTVLEDCDVLSQGADTIALWGEQSGSYLARLNICGSVDFVCPRGWCYMTDCALQQVNPKADATVWHDGSRNEDMKFVLHHCHFDGGTNVTSWILARHHHDAQFYFLDCSFSKTLSNRPPLRVIYPLNHGEPSESDKKRNHDLDASNHWGERAYFYDSHRDGGDYPWQQNNLSSATNSPVAEQITAAWTFAEKWDPERRDAPTIKKIVRHGGQIEVIFSESVTVKGKPRLGTKSTSQADYVSGSGTDTLKFTDFLGGDSLVVLDPHGGAIIASETGSSLRPANLSIPHE